MFHWKKKKKGKKKKENTRLAGSELNHRTAKAKIFPRNRQSRFKSRSAEARITLFTVGRSLVHKSHRNGLKIARFPAQICLQRCCIMRVANGEDTKFENQSLATASAQQHSVGVGRHYCLRANKHKISPETAYGSMAKVVIETKFNRSSSKELINESNVLILAAYPRQ